MTFEELTEKVSELIKEYEESTDETIGCFLSKYYGWETSCHYEFNGKNFETENFSLVKIPRNFVGALDAVYDLLETFDPKCASCRTLLNKDRSCSCCGRNTKLTKKLTKFVIQASVYGMSFVFLPVINFLKKF